MPPRGGKFAVLPLEVTIRRLKKCHPVCAKIAFLFWQHNVQVSTAHIPNQYEKKRPRGGEIEKTFKDKQKKQAPCNCKALFVFLQISSVLCQRGQALLLRLTTAKRQDVVSKCMPNRVGAGLGNWQKPTPVFEKNLPFCANFAVCGVGRCRRANGFSCDVFFEYLQTTAKALP